MSDLGREMPACEGGDLRSREPLPNLSGSGSFDDGIPDGGKRGQGEFDVLQGKGNPDDGDGAAECECQVRESEMPPRKEQPENVAKGSEAPSPQVRPSGDNLTVDHGASERPESEGPKGKTSPAPRKTDDTQGHQNADHIPVERAEDASAKKPQNV